MKKIYLASPLGFSEFGRKVMDEMVIHEIEKAGFEVINPWNLTPETEEFSGLYELPIDEHKMNRMREINQIIGKNNEKAMDICDGLVAILDGVDIDSGTASEIGYVAALNKPVIGYRGDFRQSSDNIGAVVNLQVQFFIEKMGGKVITRLEQLEAELNRLFS